MLRRFFCHNVTVIARLSLAVFACNALLSSSAYDQPSPSTEAAESVESTSAEEKLEAEPTEDEEREKEYRTALQAELDRRGLTVNSVVCDTVKRRGSRIRSRKCMTIAAWVEKRLAAKHELYKLHANRAPRSWDTGP